MAKNKEKDKEPAAVESTAASIPVPSLGSEGAGATIPLAPPPETPVAGEPVKRKRGRPPGSKSAAAVVDAPAITPEDMERAKLALSTTFHALSTMVSARRGQHWEISKEESETLGNAWAAALAPYLPKIGAAVPWVSAVVISWTVLGPRVETDIRIARAKAMAKDEGSGGPALVIP